MFKSRRPWAIESGRPGFESYPTSSCVVSGKFLNFSEHGFPVCKNSNNICFGLLSQKVVSLKVYITCSIHPVSPSPLLVLREFEWSSHPHPYFYISVKTHSQREAHRGKHSLTRPTRSRPLVWWLHSGPRATFCPPWPGAPVSTLSRLELPFWDGSSNPPSLVQDSSLRLGLDHMPMGKEAA